MSLNALGLGFMFTATDLASGVMNNIKQNFQGLEDAAGQKIDNLDKMTRRMGAGLTAAFAGLGGLAASFKMAKAAGEFEKAMARVQLKTHATGEQMKQLEGLAYEMAQEMGVAPVEAALGMKMLGQQGYQVNEILKKLPLFTKFAAAGEIELEESIDLVSQAMRTFKIDSNLMIDAMDQMLQSVDMSSGELKELPIGLARALSGAKMYTNMTLTDTLMIFNAIKDIVASPMLAGTGTSYLASRLALPKYNQMLKQLTGVNVIDKQTGQLRDIISVLAELGPVLDKVGDQKQNAILSKVFGQDGTRGVKAFFSRLKSGWTDSSGVIHKGIEGMIWNMDQIAGAEGNVERNFQKVIATFEGLLSRFSGSLKVVAIELGKPFIEVWKPILDVTIDGLKAFAKAIADMDPQTKKMIAWGVTIASALLLVGGVMGFVGAIAPLLWAGLGLVGEALAGLIPAILGAVVALGWWLVPLIGIGALIYGIQNNLGGLGDTFSDLGKVFTQQGGIIDTVVTFLKTAWDGFVEGFKESFNKIPWGLINNAFNELFDAVGKLMEQLGFFMPDGEGRLIHGFFKMLGGIIGAAVELAAAFVGGIAQVGAAILNVVNKYLKPVVTWIYDNLIAGWLIPLINGLRMIDQFKFLSNPTASIHRWANDTKDELGTERKARFLHATQLDDFGNPIDPDYKGPNVLTPNGPPRAAPPSTATSALALRDFSNQQPGQREDLINYERLAQAVSRIPPPVISIDGEKMVLTFDRARDRLNSERSGKWG